MKPAGGNWVCKTGREKEKPAGLLLSVVDFNELNIRRIGFSYEKESLKV